jgi:hypothetical protein
LGFLGLLPDLLLLRRILAKFLLIAWVDLFAQGALQFHLRCQNVRLNPFRLVVRPLIGRFHLFDQCFIGVVSSQKRGNSG